MQFTQEDIQNNKVMAVLSYFGILALIPFLAAKESPYAQYHAKQGLTLFIVEIVYSVLSIILAFIPIVGMIVSAVLGICVLVLVILGIVNAVQGQAKELPIIGMIKIFK